MHSHHAASRFSFPLSGPLTEAEVCAHEPTEADLRTLLHLHVAESATVWLLRRERDHGSGRALVSVTRLADSPPVPTQVGHLESTYYPAWLAEVAREGAGHAASIARQAIARRCAEPGCEHAARHGGPCGPGAVPPLPRDWRLLGGDGRPTAMGWRSLAKYVLDIRTRELARAGTASWLLDRGWRRPADR